jgi:hypothetical protein
MISPSGGLRRSPPEQLADRDGTAPDLVAAAVDAARNIADNARAFRRGDGRMEFGMQEASSARSWKVAKRAEEPGFTHAWAEIFAEIGTTARRGRKP